MQRKCELNDQCSPTAVFPLALNNDDWICACVSVGNRSNSDNESALRN